MSHISAFVSQYYLTLLLNKDSSCTLTLIWVQLPWCRFSSLSLRVCFHLQMAAREADLMGHRSGVLFLRTSTLRRLCCSHIPRASLWARGRRVGILPRSGFSLQEPLSPSKWFIMLLSSWTKHRAFSQKISGPQVVQANPVDEKIESKRKRMVKKSSIFIWIIQ